MAEASAPASSANLGAGFDTLALALDTRCRVRAEPAGDWSIEHRGPHAPEPGARDAVLAAAQLAVGLDRPLHLSVENLIPVARGLGSSAAASAAGALAAWRAGGIEWDRKQLFRFVAELEGHPDNAAAAVFGGLQAATTGGQAHMLSLHSGLLPVVAVPAAELLTSEARSVLSDTLTRPGVVRSLRRIVALIEGLRNGDPELLAAAAGDEIHEEPRSHMSPITGRLVAASRSAGALYACWSGAGPSVLALTDAARRPSVVAALELVVGAGGVVMSPAIDHRGAE
jgi:homoserine kinase